jgi:hypothetical protein
VVSYLFHTGNSVDGLSCPEDYEKSVTVTSHLLSLTFLEVIAQYNARTGRDICPVGPKRAVKEKNKNVGVPYNM